jgi:hypothetical protein
MKVIACLTERDVIRKVLRAMGLPEEPPRVSPARPPPDPQGRFEFVQEGDQE